MFDITGIITKNKSKQRIDYKPKLLSYYLQNINYKESQLQGYSFFIQLLSHQNENKNYTISIKNCHIFVLGQALTNKMYEEKTSNHVSLLTPYEILNLYFKYKQNFIKYIKGIFIIFIFDEVKNEYFFFNSKSGLYDLYYYFNDNFMIFSTNLETLLTHPDVPISIDSVAVIQQIIFNYPLGNKTLFKNISILNQGHYLKYSNNQILKTKYFDYLDLINSERTYSWNETYLEAPVIFNNVLEGMTFSKRKICSALTSGFDSRALLSYFLQRENINPLYYSWAWKKSGLDIKIPLEIKSRFKVNYKPILLNDDFLKNYDYFASQAIFLTDGRATIRRANHFYSYDIISKYSRDNFTGLFGSELLRPMHSVGHIFNANYIEILFSSKKEESINNIYNDVVLKNYFNLNFLQKYKKQFFEQTSCYFYQLKSIGDFKKQLYYLQLSEGFRKYFGQEIHGCRIYIFTNSPYIDDDFIEFILQTPIPDLKLQLSKRNINDSRLGQLFYVPIIENNYKKLLKIKTSHFYTPLAIKSDFFPITIVPGVVKRFLFLERHKKDSFNTAVWVKILFKKHPEIMNLSNDIFNKLEDYDKSRFLDYAVQYSLRQYLYELLWKKS